MPKRAPSVAPRQHRRPSGLLLELQLHTSQNRTLNKFKLQFALDAATA